MQAAPAALGLVLEPFRAAAPVFVVVHVVHDGDAPLAGVPDALVQAVVVLLFREDVRVGVEDEVNKTLESFTLFLASDTLIAS